MPFPHNLFTDSLSDPASLRMAFTSLIYDTTGHCVMISLLRGTAAGREWEVYGFLYSSSSSSEVGMAYVEWHVSMFRNQLAKLDELLLQTTLMGPKFCLIEYSTLWPDDYHLSFPDPRGLKLSLSRYRDYEGNRNIRHSSRLTTTLSVSSALKLKGPL